MIDPDTGAMLSRVYPLDKQANANGVRRARGSAQQSIDQSEPMDAPLCAVDEQGLSPLMRKLLTQIQPVQSSGAGGGTADLGLD